MLEVLHSKNIVHCDLKPSNIMVDKMGRMYLIDFGVSSFVGETVSYATIRFCPIEQITSKKVGVYYDIYAFGIIMYEFFTGKQLFQHSSKDEILKEKEKLVLDVSDSVLGTPRIVDEIINKAIHNKYENVKELKKDLVLLRNIIK